MGNGEMKERVKELRNRVTESLKDTSLRRLSKSTGLSASTLCRFVKGGQLTLGLLVKLDSWDRKGRKE